MNFLFVVFLQFVAFLGVQSLCSRCQGREDEVFGPAVHQLTEPFEMGEGPTWDPRTRRLYFVDIHKGKVFSYNPKNGDLYSITVNGTVAPIVPSKRNRNEFYLGVNRSVVKITWDGRNKVTSMENMTTVAQNSPLGRFNDGKADSEGRLWFGTMGYQFPNQSVVPGQGSLFKITSDNLANPEAIISPVDVSNGLAWNRANDKFYYIDSNTFEVAEYDYEAKSGQLSNKRVVINTKQVFGESALPDGMTIDRDDNLWVALHGAGAVVQIDPVRGKVMRRIAIPAQFVTSCMWGGKKLDILFVTTEKLSLSDEQILQQPAAGSLFAVKGLGTRGLPVFGGDI